MVPVSTTYLPLFTLSLPHCPQTLELCQLEETNTHEENRTRTHRGLIRGCRWKKPTRSWGCGRDKCAASAERKEK